MFGFGNDKKPDLVGAKEKVLKAKKFNKNYQVQSKKEGKPQSPVVPALIVLCISVLFAFILTEGVLKTGVGLRIGNAGLDKLLFGPGQPSLTGDTDTDYGLVIFLRGIVIFILGGIIPLCTLIWQRLIDRAQMNIYVAFWGVSISLGLIYYLIKDSLTPILKDVADALF
jgi:hypothetical protein